jgi:hypothetical protein
VSEHLLRQNVSIALTFSAHKLTASEQSKTKPKQSSPVGTAGYPSPLVELILTAA